MTEYERTVELICLLQAYKKELANRKKPKKLTDEQRDQKRRTSKHIVELAMLNAEIAWEGFE